MTIRAALTAARAIATGATLVTTLVTTLTACGQRGALYMPGKPGDPYFDRQQRGAAGANPGLGTTPATTAPATAPATAPNSTVPGNAPGLPPDPRPTRADDSPS